MMPLILIVGFATVIFMLAAIRGTLIEQLTLQRRIVVQQQEIMDQFEPITTEAWGQARLKKMQADEDAAFNRRHGR